MRKPLVVAVGLLALVSFIAGATAIGDNVIGTWVNVDPDTGGLVQLVFLPDGLGGIQVFGYGACTPDPCEWGAAPLIPLVYPASYDPAEWGMAVWDFGGGMMTVAIIRLEGEYMVVEDYSILGPGSGGMKGISLLRYVP